MPFLEFCVAANTNEAEFVGIVGNKPALGEWQLEKAKPLTLDLTVSKWRAKINFESPGDLEYRYFIGLKVKDEDGNERIIVKQWESGPSLFVRKAKVPADDSQVITVDGGSFGIIDGKKMVDCGWLSGHSEIRLTFSDNGEAPIVSFRSSDTPVDGLQISLEAEGSIVNCEARSIKPFKYEKSNPADKKQLPKNDEVLIYVVGVVDFCSFSGHFTIYDQTGNVIGYSAVLGDQLKESTSYLKSPILNSNGKGIGVLHMEYVAIKPYKNQEALNMKEGYGSYWRKRETLHIGHRGSGNSFTAETKSNLYENTLSSFRRASMHSADMIEFDVQLTKDKIPIVFHDFTICASVTSKQGGRKSLHEVEVQSLTYDHLMEYQTRHRARKLSSSVDPEFEEDDAHPELRPFPTLKEVMKEVPEHTGFDIELKWPEYNIDKSWSHGVEKFCPANEFVDKILDVVLECCGKRRIFFSSFDANICCFLRRKQNRFPVIFLMDEGSDFMELRSRFNRLAIPFSSSEGFLGICFSEESAYGDENFIDKVHAENLLVMFYGDKITERENRERMIERGADGVIYDRIHQTLQEGPNRFQLEANAASQQ